jgi:hypothetical protein
MDCLSWRRFDDFSVQPRRKTLIVIMCDQQTELRNMMVN